MSYLYLSLYNVYFTRHLINIYSIFAETKMQKCSSPQDMMAFSSGSSMSLDANPPTPPTPPTTPPKTWPSSPHGKCVNPFCLFTFQTLTSYLYFGIETLIHVFVIVFIKYYKRIPSPLYNISPATNTTTETVLLPFPPHQVYYAFADPLCIQRHMHMARFLGSTDFTQGTPTVSLLTRVVPPVK